MRFLSRFLDLSELCANPHAGGFFPDLNLLCSGNPRLCAISLPATHGSTSHSPVLLWLWVAFRSLLFKAALGMTLKGMT